MLFEFIVLDTISTLYSGQLYNWLYFNLTKSIMKDNFE